MILNSPYKRRAILLLVCLTFSGSATFAGSVENEINLLLDSVGQSTCSFVRNGKTYSPEEAQAHLAMKYRRGKSHVTTAEEFISHLASKSSLSGKPYTMLCKGQPEQKVGDWLMQNLQSLRAAQTDSG